MPYQELTSAQRNAVQIPGRFQCSICKVHKNAEHFSNNELKGVQWKKGLNPSLNGRSAKLRCRICTGSQRQELECLKCGDTKDLSKFSKSSRKAGGNHWCIDCTLYKESATPNSAQADAIPQEEWDPSNVKAGQPGGQGWDDAPSSVVERESLATTPSFAHRRGPNDPFDPLSAQLAATKLGGAHALSASSGPNLTNYVPPHLRGMRDLSKDENKSVSSASNLFEDARSAAATSDLGSGWQSVDAKRRQNQGFTAYGPNGEQQYRMSRVSSSAERTPLTSGPLTPLATTSLAPVERSGGWARPAGSQPTTQTALPAPQRAAWNNRDDSDSDFDDP